VTGLAKATATSARKATAGLLGSHPILRTQVQKMRHRFPVSFLFKESRLQHHGEKVALRHYDLELGTLKANAVCWMSEISGDKLEADAIPEYMQERRRRRDRDDLAVSLDAAQRTLQEGAKRRNPVKKRTKQWNLAATEREMFQRVLSDPSNNEMAAATLQDRIFPSDGRGEH
jgi:hypothetical protein